MAEGQAANQSATQTVMRRKAGAGRDQAEAPQMTPERGLTLALSKVAQDQLQLPLRVAEITESRMSLADLPEKLEALSLLAVMEGPSEALGLIAVPPATLSALIEVQTMGSVAATPAAPRKPTRIDASMVAEFLDHVMESFEAFLAPLPAITWAGGFRYASFLDDPRPLGLLLEDVSFRVYHVRLQLGAGGKREGGLLMALPAQGKGRGPRKPAAAPVETPAGGDRVDGAAEAQAQAEWQDQLEQTVMGARVDLTGVLHRITLSLAQVAQFKEGTVIPVPYAALEGLQIEAIGRRRVATARLGQSHGMRALRVRPMEDSELESGERAGEGYRIAAPSEARDGARAPLVAGVPDDPLGGLSALGDLPRWVISRLWGTCHHSGSCPRLMISRRSKSAGCSAVRAATARE